MSTYPITALAATFGGTPEEVDRTLYLAGFNHVYEPDGDHRYPLAAVRWLIDHLPEAADDAVVELHHAAADQRKRFVATATCKTGLVDPTAARFEL